LSYISLNLVHFRANPNYQRIGSEIPSMQIPQSPQQKPDLVVGFQVYAPYFFIISMLDDMLQRASEHGIAARDEVCTRFWTLQDMVRNHRRLKITLLIVRNPLSAHQLTDRLHLSRGNSRKRTRSLSYSWLHISIAPDQAS